MDLPGSLSLLEPEPEGKERSLEQDLSKVLISEEFELEGVCQLPDQSPPKDSASVTEETSWGQFGLGRKRFLSAKEESEYKVKRVCDSLSEDPQASKQKVCSPRWSALPLHSVGDDEVFVSGKFIFQTNMVSFLSGEVFGALGGLESCGTTLTSWHLLRLHPTLWLHGSKLSLCQWSAGLDPVSTAVPRKNALLS